MPFLKQKIQIYYKASPFRTGKKLTLLTIPLYLLVNNHVLEAVRLIPNSHIVVFVYLHDYVVTLTDYDLLAVNVNFSSMILYNSPRTYMQNDIGGHIACFRIVCPPPHMFTGLVWGLLYLQCI